MDQSPQDEASKAESVCAWIGIVVFVAGCLGIGFLLTSTIFK